MVERSANKQPTFFWQGALIVLPVIVLAAIGVVSLRQDKLLAQHEAAERAQALADELAPKVWSELSRSNSSAEYSFQTDPGGQLTFPPVYPSLPVPRSFDTAKLDPAQAELWFSARRAEVAEDGREAAITAYGKFLDQGPPEPFRATALYSLGVLLDNAKQPRAAAQRFEAILQDEPKAVGESGLPLRPLAELKLLDLAEQDPGAITHPITVETVCSNAVQQPTPISPEVLRVAAARAKTAEQRRAVQQWQTRWDEQEVSRALFQTARPHLEVGEPGGTETGRGSASSKEERMFWFTSPVLWKRSIAQPPEADKKVAVPPTVEIEGNDWLAVLSAQTESNAWFRCLGESEAGVRVSAALRGARQIPDYFGVGFELAGRKLTWSVPDLRVWHEVNYFGRRGGGQKKELVDKEASTVLASASPREAGGEQLRVNVYLTSQAALFKRQYARTFWFGALVAAAALAALGGLLAAYRAFHRQLRLSEMKSNFVSSVSHELRAPIASVRLMAESLERGKVSELSRQQEYFRFIVQECRRLSALIENVLDFSRIEQGRKEYELEPTDILALLRQTVKLMEPYAAERQVSLTLAGSDCQVPAVQEQIAVDGKAIQQALINLIDNAIKHSPKGQSVRIGVETVSGEAIREDGSTEVFWASEPEAVPKACVDLWVEDDGEGIPPADHEKIFERFFRRGSELRRETSGVGIGLSIVKHIVEAHEGRVLVRSDVGQGSRFTIRLPVGTAAREGQS